MKIYVLLFLVLFFSNLYSQHQIKLKYTSKQFNLTIPNLPLNQWGLAGGVGGGGNVSGAVRYEVNGQEHIISNSVDSLSPALHFIKDSTGNWVFENYYWSGAVTGGFRNYSFMDSLGTIAFANTGSEAIQPWPYGDLLVCRTTGKTLNWTKLNGAKSFYHSVATGDLNGDKITDVLGIKLATNGPWDQNALESYMQNPNFVFKADSNLTINYTPQVFPNPWSGAAVLIADVDGDGISEIVRGEYKGDSLNPTFRYGIAIYKKNVSTGKFDFFKSPTSLGVFSNFQQGATSIKAADFNHDGFIDLAVATEGPPANRIQIFNGDANRNFTPGQLINYGDTSRGYPDSTTTFREFEVMDFNGDGWDDIVVHPSDYGKQFRIKPGPYSSSNPNSWYGSGIRLQSCIWKNNKGFLDTIKNDLSIPNIYPGYMKGFFVNGKLKFFGFEMQYNDQNPGRFTLYDVTLFDCNKLTKPLFNTSKYSFCSGDSLKLTVTNTNKGDTLKWYYGTKSDLTNISNKTFTDSTKLFVTRTDSVNCIISSDTIQLSKYSAPVKPAIAWNGTQFTATTSSTGVNYQWLLSNSSVSGATSANYKPTAIGSYKIQITDANGCKNVSDSFSLVVTAVNPSIETSTDHIAKIAPNPASTYVMLYFKQKPTKTLTIRVMNLKGQVLKQITTNSQSTHVSLSEILSGNYIIEIIGKGYNQTQQLLITK